MDQKKMPEEVSDQIYRIRVPLPNNPLKELNSYFIKGTDRNLLIDTGFNRRECWDALTDGLKVLHADMDKTDIFLTHLHSDHSGLAPALIRNGRHIYISRIDEKWLDDDAFIAYSWKTIRQNSLRSGIPDDIREAMFQANPAIDYAPDASPISYDNIADGDFVDVGAYHFRCVATPGHTPGEMCLWDEKHQLMILGDHLLFDITPNITYWADVEDSLGDYLNSLHRVEDFDVRLALPGHREIGDFRSRIEELFQHHDCRLEECREALRKKADSTAYEVAGQITWNIRKKSWETFPSTQLLFAMGECQAHLNYLMKRGEVVSEPDANGILHYRLV